MRSPWDASGRILVFRSDDFSKTDDEVTENFNVYEDIGYWQMDFSGEALKIVEWFEFCNELWTRSLKLNLIIGHVLVDTVLHWENHRFRGFEMLTWEDLPTGTNQAKARMEILQHAKTKSSYTWQYDADGNIEHVTGTVHFGRAMDPVIDEQIFVRRKPPD